MRTLAAALALGVAFSATPFLSAAQSGPAHTHQVQAKKHMIKGTVTSNDDGKLVVSVTNKKTGDKKDRKIKTDDKTKVTVDGKEAKLADIKSGMEVTITPGENRGDPASEIEATSPSK